MQRRIALFVIYLIIVDQSVQTSHKTSALTAIMKVHADLRGVDKDNWKSAGAARPSKSIERILRSEPPESKQEKGTG